MQNAEKNIAPDRAVTFGSEDTATQRHPPLCGVVITCYNHGRYLADAIESVLRQTLSDFEIIVVDDGSTDNTREVAAQYSMVKYVFQQNQGLSAARNTGIKHSAARYLIFLDADDLLLPQALAVGVRCFEQNSNCAFVSGLWRRVSESGEPFFTYVRPPISGSHYRAFLRGNYIGMHATVLYQRWVFEKIGGFDSSLRACEDYDMYLRVSRDYPVAVHEHLVADYRSHGENMSANLALMVRASTHVLTRQRDRLRDQEETTACAEGIRRWRNYYTDQMLMVIRKRGGGLRGLVAARHIVVPFAIETPQSLARLTAMKVKTKAKTVVKRMIPRRVRRLLKGRTERNVPIGGVRFGDLRRVEPISRHYGFDRGLPIDRYYIEAFLEKHANAIRGRVLEIGDDTYTRRFGRNAVEKSDVLHIHEGNPKATLVGDISVGDTLPGDAFDCIILTQTLHLVYEVRNAIATLHRILKPGGVLLLTVPGTISQIEAGTWRDIWHWGFTELSIRKLMEERFDSSGLNIEVNGNVLASIAFLQGIAAGELKPEELNAFDPLYPLLLTVRARKSS